MLLRQSDIRLSNSTIQPCNFHPHFLRCMNMCNSKLVFFENCVPHLGQESFLPMSVRVGSGTNSPSSSWYRPASIVFFTWSFRYLISLDRASSRVAPFPAQALPSIQDLATTLETLVYVLTTVPQ